MTNGAAGGGGGNGRQLPTVCSEWTPVSLVGAREGLASPLALPHDPGGAVK